MNDQKPVTSDDEVNDSTQPTAEPSAEETNENAASPQPVDPLTEAQAQAETYLNAWKRAAADHQNYKKQQEKQRAIWVAMANQELMLALLPLFDDLHMAMENVTDEIRSTKWFEGLMLIQKKQDKALKDAGLEVIDADGKPFDPNYHEAVMQESVQGIASGTVTAVLQKGYMLGGRVIRPSMVKVAQ